MVVRAGPPTLELLDFYARPSGNSDAGRHAARLASLPDGIAEIANAIQGLLIYADVAQDYYGVDIPPYRLSETHLRRAEAMLDQVLALDGRPLNLSRPLDKRLVGVCRHYALLLVAALRAKHIPARARCGFAAYFNAPYQEDHWICEAWNALESRWVRVDAQLDEVWRSKHSIGFDVLDLPRDRFVTAAEAWQACRAGRADPARYGIYKGNLRGLWFIAGNLVRDLAALNKVEVLPFDVWGAQPRSDERLDSEQLAHFDWLAELTRLPDDAFDTLRRLYEHDDTLRVPAHVFNAVLQERQPFP
jgi:transglutaminase-like putative cysteine protease